jgi:Fe-S-cluster-containing dehydrogenase component/DMSO reductase anchor subunit
MTATLASTPVALSPKPTAKRLPAVPETGPELLPLNAGEQYRFAFDMNVCIGCHSCEVACGEQNGLPTSTAWRRVGEIEGGVYPAAKRYHLSMSCNQCVEPLCLEGCPTNAYEKLSNGVVAHHADDCIGCQYCTWTCPYSVPAFQPDRRIVTKCDMCLPRLDAGMAPACVAACPTGAITVEKVNVAAWRDDHTAGNAPHLPDAGITTSTTRIILPNDVPEETFAASDWNVTPEDPHWPLVWLTVMSQLSVGIAALGSSDAHRLVAAMLAAAAMAGALLHLGRPAMAWKALRNLRRSWLSREVALLSLYAGAAALAVVVPYAQSVAAFVGVAGLYASARLYVVPGRPAWFTPLTITRFMATAAALGGAATDRPAIAIAGGSVALASTAANWGRLAANGGFGWRGVVALEFGRFRFHTILRWFGVGAGCVAVAVGVPAVGFVLLAAGEAGGRWLFFVSAVPSNMPGSFWRGTSEHHR